MSEIDYLDLEDLLELVRRLGVGPVRDVGLLDAAAARPRSSAYGTDAYPSLDLKAAALLHSLVRNHALVDGNKRLAWLATVVFLDLNGRCVELGDDEAFELVMSAAAGELDVEGIAERLATTECQAPGTAEATISRTFRHGVANRGVNFRERSKAKRSRTATAAA